jgi:hypothetical protein
MIKVNFILVLQCIFFINLAISQNVFYTENNIIEKQFVVTSINETIDVKTHLFHNSVDSQTIEWEVKAFMNIFSWEYYFCDIEVCYTLFDVITENSFKLAPNDTATLKFSVSPNLFSGSDSILLTSKISSIDSTEISIILKTSVSVDSSTTAISESNLTNLSLSLFPNPSGDFIYLNNDHDLKNIYLTIYNYLGEELTNIQIENKTNVLDIKSLSNGFYTAIITNNDKYLKTMHFFKK